MEIAFVSANIIYLEIEDEYDSQYLTNEEIGKNKYIFSARLE